MRTQPLVVILALTLSVAARAEPAPDFDRAIAPLLVQRCLDCHGGPEPKGKLDLSRRDRAMAGGEDGKVIAPGRPDDSPLWDLIDRGKMPPKKGLPPAERELLKAWIAAGAKWGTDPIDAFARSTDRRAGNDWWSLRPLTSPTIPPIRNTQYAIRNPIDNFVLAALESKGLHPSPEADKRLLLRRLYFDLTGLPPAPQDIDAFLADAAPDAYEKVVDRLLASPQYGVRWARHWLDVARFGESNGFEFDEFRASAWPYRDWVVDALNRDLPFDEFARLQIAGDVLHPDRPGAITATGFLVAGAYDTPGQTQQSLAMRKVVRQDELEDVTGTLGQTFLGLTVQCARCHDHKFDPIRQAEYYRLTAALAGVRHGERDLPLDPAPLAEARQRLAAATAALAEIEAPARRKILADRKASPVPAPAAIARWDFREGLADTAGDLNVRLVGEAQLTKDGLKVGAAKAFAVAGPLRRDLSAKTLEAWVRLDKLDQRGGGVISVQSPDGALFDSIVFGEQQPARWMAGSNFFTRTKPFAGEDETAAASRFVHLAITYTDAGVVTGYRDGRPYGEPYTTGVAHFKRNDAEILFGLRFGQPSGDRLIAGVIQRAALYDRALSDAEVAASAAAATDFVSPDEIAAALAPPDRDRRRPLVESIERDRKLLAAGRGKTYAVAPRAPEKVHVLTRGNTAQPAEEVAAGGVAAVPGASADFHLPADAPEGQRRVALANWVTDPKNPLFPRVIVNRLWHYHFGVGLVETPNDFGFNGGRPSHPELLDHLAGELVRHRYSLKAIHRLIVTSATYRQSSRPDPKAMAADAGNRLLWHKTPLRMEAETVRDAVLAIAGQLDLTTGGPGFREFSVAAVPGTAAVIYTPLDPADQTSTRRTLYRVWARGGRSGLLDALDCPDPSATAPARAVTNTPLQALAMLNNATILRTAEAFATRVGREAQGADAEVGLAYRLAYGRPPSPDELALARDVVTKHGLSALTRALFNSNEFLFVE